MFGNTRFNATLFENANNLYEKRKLVYEKLVAEYLKTGKVLKNIEALSISLFIYLLLNVLVLLYVCIFYYEHTQFPLLSLHDISSLPYFLYLLRVYLTCIQSMDDQIGLILQQLEDMGVAEDTLVIYSSDQVYL